MPTKQELLNTIFWLKLTCIRLGEVDLAFNLQELHLLYATDRCNPTLLDRVFKHVRQAQNILSDRGIDWEKTLSEIMAANYYQSFKQMRPDFGF